MYIVREVCLYQQNPSLLSVWDELEVSSAQGATKIVPSRRYCTLFAGAAVHGTVNRTEVYMYILGTVGRRL